jgi:hypothetical protein
LKVELITPIPSNARSMPASGKANGRMLGSIQAKLFRQPRNYVLLSRQADRSGTVIDKERQSRSPSCGCGDLTEGEPGMVVRRLLFGNALQGGQRVGGRRRGATRAFEDLSNPRAAVTDQASE